MAKLVYIREDDNVREVSKVEFDIPEDLDIYELKTVFLDPLAQTIAALSRPAKAVQVCGKRPH